MRIVIAGGTGFLGRAVALALSAEGHDIVVLSRRPEQARRRLPGSIELHRWDMNADGNWRTALEKTGAVLNFCGEIIAGVRWTQKKKDRIVASRIEPTKALVSAVAKIKSRPAVFINASAIGYYGDQGDRLVEESTGPGSGFLAELCVAWEDAALQMRESGVRVVTPRIGLVLGEHSSAFGMLLFPFKLGLGGRIGNGRQWMSWIHLADLVGLVKLALERESIDGALNATSPGAVTNAEFTRILARRLHRPAILHVPAPLLKIVLGEMGSIALAGQRVVPQKALAAGYRFRYADLGAAFDQMFANVAGTAAS